MTCEPQRSINMKRTWFVLLGSLLLAAPASVQGQFLYYDNGDGTCTVTSYTGTNAVVIIPTNIDNLTVTVIGDGDDPILSGTEVTSVTIPNSATTIEGSAFSETGLRSITISASVSSIGEDAFLGCTNLTTITVVAQNPFYSSTNGVLFNENQTTLVEYPGGVEGTYTIPGSVTSIGDDAFAEASVTSVTIPAGVTNIGAAAFGSCYNLTTIIVAVQNAFYSSTNGVLFNENQTTLIQYPGGFIGSFTIPGTVSGIGAAAFAFCTNLTTLIIPNSVITIGQQAFEGCWNLTNITIGTNVTTIGQQAFLGCGRLTNVTIPGSVSTIGTAAFRGCSSLTNVTISNGVTTIGTAAFESCWGLLNITIPASVIGIGEAPFNTCVWLTNITVAGQNPNYSSTNGVLFDKSQTTLIEYPGGRIATCYAIPPTVTTIAFGAFFFCPGLSGVTIPGSVTSIGSEAFENCLNLTNVTISNGVTTIGQQAFLDCASLTSVYFTGNAPTADCSAFEDHPANLTVYYLPGTTGWGPTFACIPTKEWTGITIMITANPTNGAVPLTVSFASGDVDSTGNTISGWYWTFGDGSTSTARNPSHTYTTMGTFYPDLIATNSLGGLAVGLGPTSITTTNAPVYSGLVLNGGFETDKYVTNVLT